MEYQPASSDRLTVTLNVGGTTDCSLIFTNFTSQISTTRGITAANLVPLMNYIQIDINRGATSYTSTLSNLTLNDVTALGSFSPGATSPTRNHITGFQLGSGFKLSGTIDLSGSFGVCASACDVEIRFGTLPSQIVVNKTVSGLTPYTTWQFAGPKGAFNVPNIGGTSVITPLGSAAYTISETLKPGFTASTSCTNGASGSDSVSVTPDAGATITCTFANTLSAVYSTITVTPAITNGWVSFEELSASSLITPIALDIQSVPSPVLGIGTPRFELTNTNVGKLYASAILTGTKLGDMLVLTYSTYLEPGGQVPAIQIGWDDNATAANTGFRGRLVFVPNAPSTGAWQTWNTLDDTAGTWFTTLSGASACTQAVPCTWSQVLSNYPNASIHGNPSVPYGFVGVKTGSGGTGVSYFDGLTIAANQNVVTYDFEPACNPYRVFNLNTGEAFCGIQQAIDDANTVTDHTISVTAGTYTELVDINKPLTLLGPNAGIDPNTGMRLAEAIIMPTASDPLNAGFNGPIVVSLNAANIVFDGFTVDGDNPALTSGVLFNGADVDAEFGIYGEATPNPKATIRNNIVKNIGEFAVWVTAYYGNSSGTSTLSNNKVDNVLGVYGQGLRIADNAWGDVRDNVVTRVRSGIVIENFSANTLGQTSVISGNTVSSMRIGIRHNLHYNYGTPGFTILNNQIQSYLQNPVITTGMPTSFQGIRVESIQQTVGVTVTDNVITGNRNVLTGGGYTRVEGLNVTNASSTSPNILFQRNIVTNTLRGLYHETPASVRALDNSLNDNTTGVELEPGAGLLISGTTISNGDVGILTRANTTLTATKNLINNNANGMLNNSNPANVLLTRNDLSLNTTSAISNVNASLLNAECNWFGSNAGPGASVQGNVDANPWLVSSDLNGDCSLATLVVEKVVSGVPTYVPWQFAGPTGTFTLPAAGGSFTLTNLNYGPTLITETARLGYVATSSCTNGATGNNVVTPTLLGSTTVTCTFTNAITPIVTTETVKLSQLGTWLFVEEGPSGSGTFVAGPATPPLGAGSAQLTVNATGRYILLTPTYTGTRFADITTLQYSTYVSAGNPASTAPVLQLNVDYNLTDVITSWQGRLSFEPYMSGTVVQDTWQTWDALQGKWWASGAPGNTVCPQSSPCTWQQVLNAFPEAGINANAPGVQFRAGGPWAPGFTGHVDAFTMGVGDAFTTYDFEPETPCTTTCYVDAVNGHDLFGGTTISNAKKTIQAAIDTVAISGTIRVLPGTYSETASNRYLFDNTGPYQFGLFFPDDKPGISVIGVTASDAPITSYAGALATINTNATNNFGPSGIFVEGDNITLQGLRIGTNTPWLNKTIEIIGDAFTLKNCDIADPEGSIYINDFRFDTGTNTSHVKSYTIDGNRMDEGVSVDISSGAGFSGPVSGRQIINNVFNIGPYATWPAISFNGSGTGVPWFVYSVGGAVIQGNTFSGSNVQYIRTRGDVDESQFDWSSYWNDNTYDKGVMVVIDPTPPYTPSVYTYTAGGYTFTNVSAIFATIQDGVDAANAGETVLIKSGVYTGTDNVVTINKNRLMLIGAGANSTIISRTVAGPASGILIAPAITGTNISNLAVLGFNQGGICGQSMNNNTVISGTQVLSNTASGGCQGGIHFTGPVTNVTITGNEATYNTSRGIVIWDGFKQHITITNNIARNNNCCGIELQDGTASGVLMSGNTVYDNADSGMSATGLMAGAGPNVISNNTVRNNGRFGIELKLSNGTGASSGDGSILVISNTVELTAAIGVIKPGEDRDLAGIAAYRRAWVPGYNNVDIPVGVVIQGNTVSGYQQPSASDGFGIAVEGIRMSVLSNTLSNNDVGAQVQAGHLPYDPNNLVINGDQSNLPDQYFGRGNSPVACGYTEAGNSFAGNTTITRTVGSVSPGGVVVNMNTNEMFCTIQAAIDDSDTVNGHTISVTAGIYPENVNVTKVLTITGAGSGNNPAVDTIVQGTGVGNGFVLSNGTNAAQRQVLQNLRVAGFINGVLPSSYATLDGIVVVSNTNGLNLNSLSDLRILNSHIDGNGDGLGGGVGLRVGTAVNVNGVSVISSTFDGNGSGWFLAAGTPANSSTVQNVVVENTTFNNNIIKGIYAEKLEDALFRVITVTNSGISSTYGFNNGIDINLKYGAYQNIYIYDSSITGSGALGSATDPTNTAAVAIKARDDAPSYSTVSATLDNVVISRTVISGPVNGIRFGEFGKTNATPTHARVNNSSINAAVASYGLVKNITAPLDASCSWWQDATGPSSTANLNPGGLGRALTGTNTSGLDFNPWLTTSDLNSDCASATLVIQKVVSGITPFAAWQFAGPTGTFTLPAAGGSFTLTNLSYGPTAITETVKPGFVSTAACTSGETGNNVVTPTLLGSATVTCTFTNAITPVYSIITVTPAITNGWASFAEPSPGAAYLIPFDIQSLPTPALGIGNAAFVLTQTNVGKLYASALLTGTRLADLLVLTYSTYLEPGGQVPTIQIGWDDDATDTNTGFRGRIFFAPNAPTTNAWQSWNALSDSAGTWYSTSAGPCNLSSSGCTWSQLLTLYPNATIHGSPSVPYGFVGVKAGSGGTGVSYFDGLTIAANHNVVTYDFEPACNPYRVFNLNTGEAFCGIQQAIDDADTVAGHTISVTAGTYTEAVTLNKSNLYLIGAGGAASTTIVGPKSGAGNDTVLFSAPGVTLDGFTVTRDGNNPADWASNVRNQGVNLSSTDGTLKNSIITGNRNGVLIAVSSNTVDSNDIVDNRTGIQVINVAGNFTVTNNNILNNWTVGILFRQDASVGDTVIANNRLTGNWYSQLEDRGNPAGITRTIESNYWGDYPFTLTISNTSGEPGYLSQIPVQFGGSAVPPASTPVFVVNPYDPNPNGDPGGKGNLFTARLDYEPWLCNGTDTAPAIGFQPITTTLCDSTPPDTFISSGPISPTASNTATFVFSGTDDITPEALLTFECSLDGGAFSTCINPKNYTGLSDGLRTFAVRAMNPAGITDTTPATYDWFVDTTAPNTSITSGPISPTAAITSVFTFTGTDGVGTGVVSFECRLNGSAWGDCNSPITYTTGLTEGLNTFEVRATDAVSNTDATPATYTWMLDTTAPETTITSSPAMTTSAPYATFAFTGTDGTGTGVIGFECSLDGVTFTTCTSPQVFVGLTNGPHTFAVRAIDAVGNVDPTPATYTWLIDLVAPVTSITSAPSSPTNTTSATLVFTGTDAGGSGIAFFEYRLDGGTWLSTTGTSVNYTGLSNGSHQFDVRAVDSVGNVDLTYATSSWMVDTLAPDTFISIAPTSPTITSTATFVFTGTDNLFSPASLTFECSLNGGVFTACSSPQTYTGLSDGLNTFAVRAVDGLGNTDATPATAEWVVDTAAPDTTITLTPTTPTSSTVVSIPFTGSDAGSGIAAFRCSLDGVTPTLCSSPASYVSLSDGTHTFSVFAIDNVGNADPTPASVSWTVDTIAPSVSITSAPASPTSSVNATFAFTGTDVGVGIAGYECKLDAGAWTSCTSPQVYTGLSDGNHTFMLSAIDSAGNVSTPASHLWLVDTVTPSVSITSAPVSPTTATSATVSFTGSDGSGSGIAFYECQLDGAGWSTCTSPANYTSLSDGTHTVEVRATDAVSNTSAPDTATWLVDTTPPDTLISNGPVSPTNSTSASFVFTGTDSGSGVAGFECQLNGGIWSACSSPFTTTVSNGQNTFNVRAIDNAGNVDPTPATYEWFVDTTPPNTLITSAPISPTNVATATFTFTGTDVSGVGVASFECSLDGAGWSTCTSPITYTSLTDGLHTFEVRATDAVSNTDPTPASHTWLVDAGEPDTFISSTPAMTTNAPFATFVFSGTADAVLFECSLNGSAWSVCVSPKTYTGLSSGVYTFEVRAVDGANNADSTPATYTWLVDLVAPVTSITSAPSSPTSSTSATLTFTGTDAGGSGIAFFEYRLDGGSWLTTTSTTVSYTGLSNGSHQFDVRAVDNVGNIDLTYASTVWTIDSVAPETAITSAPASIVMTSTANFVFTGTDAGGTGVAYYEYTLDGGSTLTTTGTSLTFTGLSDGPHTFTVAAVDNVGNVDATPASASWTVDTQAPNTTITLAPTTPTSSTTASIAFTGSDSGSGIAGFMCSLDGITPTMCISPVNLIGLSDGTHTFTVYAIDNVGNADPTPASTTWVVDTTAPSATITASPASPTNSVAASFTFTGTDIGTGIAGFECKLDAGAWTSCTSPKAYTSLSDGSHTFMVRAVDNVGNLSTPATHTWQIDTTGPVATITGSPVSPTITTTAVLTFTGNDGSGAGLAGFECSLNGGAFTACSSPQTYTSLGDGLNTFAVQAIDTLGNVGAPVTATWVIDILPPDTTITLAPTSPTSSTTASIAFTGSDSGSGIAGFMCSLDGATYESCSSPANLIGLSDGSHTFMVYAVDAVGNADPTPASTTWVVDATAPDTSITSSPAPQTNTASATFVFTGTDSGTGVAGFECSLDAGTWASCASPKSYTGLSDGNHAFAVRAIDNVGNVDPMPATFTWLVDTTAPDALITMAPASLISSTTASVTFTATDGAGSGVAGFECQLDSGGYSTCSSPITYTSLSDGLHMVDVRSIDNVGNVETSPASTAFTVDATPPTTTIDIAPPAIDGTDASFSFSGDDGSGSGVAGFQCSLDGGAWAACASPLDYIGLSTGSHTFEVRAVDNAGNVDATPASHTWTVDGNLPNTTITSAPLASNSDVNATIVFTGSDATTPVNALVFACSFDGSAWATCTSPFAQTGLAQGTHTFMVRAIDEGNNVDPSPATVTWLVDTVAPDTTITSAPPAITSSNSAVIAFIGTDALVPASNLTFECSVDGSAWAVCTSPLALTSLTNGNHTVLVRAIDTADNVDATPASTTWLVDATAPDTFIMTGPANLTNQTSASFTFSSTGSLSAVTYQCQLDGGAWAACLTPYAVTSLSDGTHILNVRATSAAGLTDATPASTTWIVDSTAPDTTITVEPPAVSGSTVSFSFNGSDGSGSGVSSFACSLDGGAWTACNSPKSYTGLSNGDHTFEVRAIDNAGNVDATPASDEWTVDSSLPETVLLSTPPADSPSSSASFTFVGTDDTESSSALTYECRLDGGAWTACTSPKSYTGMSDGSHTFEVRAKDTGGNVDPTPASYIWTVDTSAPNTTITSGPMTMTFATTASFVFTGTDALTTASDLTFECRVDGGAWSACSSPKGLTSLTVGTHVFDVRAIDGAGNVDATPATYNWEVKPSDIVLTRRLYLPNLMQAAP